MRIAWLRIRNQKWACVSIALSLIVTVILGIVFGLSLSYPYRDLTWMEGILIYTLRLGLFALIIAVIGLFRDQERILSAMAIFLWLATGIILTLILHV